jgi:hypothetical protein
MSPGAVRAFSVTVAVFVNVGLAALLLWVSMHPQRLYGEPRASDGIGYAVLATLPIVNLLALLFTRANSSAARAFTNVVSWVNRIGAGLGVLFGIASCLELSYSTPEIVATILLVVPPLVTALALWASKRSLAVSSPA